MIPHSICFVCSCIGGGCLFVHLLCTLVSAPILVYFASGLAGHPWFSAIVCFGCCLFPSVGVVATLFASFVLVLRRSGVAGCFCCLAAVNCGGLIIFWLAAAYCGGRLVFLLFCGGLLLRLDHFLFGVGVVLRRGDVWRLIALAC